MDTQLNPGTPSVRPTIPANEVSRLLTPHQEFMLLLPQFESLLEKFLGKPVRRSPEKAIKDFGLLPEPHQLGVLKVLRIQQSLIEHAIAGETSAYDERAMLRLAMEKLEFLMDDNLLDKVESGDVVEILDPNQIQIYRSFSCFALCNYSVAELVTYPWFMLYERPSWVHHKLVELGTPIYMDGPGFQGLDTLQPYTVQELLTEEKAAFLIQEKFLARIISRLSGETYLLSVKKVSTLEASNEDNLAILGRARPTLTLLS